MISYLLKYVFRGRGVRTQLKWLFNMTWREREITPTTTTQSFSWKCLLHNWHLLRMCPHMGRHSCRCDTPNVPNILCDPNIPLDGNSSTGYHCDRVDMSKRDGRPTPLDSLHSLRMDSANSLDLFYCRVIARRNNWFSNSSSIFWKIFLCFRSAVNGKCANTDGGEHCAKTTHIHKQSTRIHRV